MSIAPISASPSTGNTASAVSATAVSSASVVSSANKGFAALLAKAGSDKAQSEKDARAKAKSAIGNTAILALPGLVTQQLPADPRSWHLSLPRDSKTNAAAGDRNAGNSSTVDDAEEARAHPAAALRGGEVAFAVNFTKSAPVGVPPVHGSSSNAKAPVMPSPAQSSAAGAPAQSAGSQNSGSQRENNGKNQHQDSSGNSSDPVAPVSGGTASQATAQPTQNATSTATGAIAPVADATNAHLAPALNKTSTLAPAALASEIAEPHAPTAVNSQNLDFRIAGADDREVNVRVSQRAGDVQVTVRTGDPGLAESLRSHLPELSDRLTQSGVQGEIWRPSAASGSGGSGADTESNSGPSEDAQAFGSGSGNASGNRNKNDQQQNAWLNELFGAQKES